MSEDTMIPLPGSEDLARWNKRIRKTDTCWIWGGTRLRKGYGSFFFAGRSRKAHRLAWEWHNRKPIPPGLFVCHSCDNPSCVNPDHLWTGTAKDNNTDMAAKNRVARMIGESHGCARLREADVRVIKAQIKAGEQQKIIAARFGVSTSTINRINMGTAWSHV